MSTNSIYGISFVAQVKKHSGMLSPMALTKCLPSYSGELAPLLLRRSVAFHKKSMNIMLWCASVAEGFVIHIEPIDLYGKKRN
jgi:ABC-type arginine/histidine transport system permease subunit